MIFFNEMFFSTRSLHLISDISAEHRVFQNDLTNALTFVLFNIFY